MNTAIPELIHRIRSYLENNIQQLPSAEKVIERIDLIKPNQLQPQMPYLPHHMIETLNSGLETMRQESLIPISDAMYSAYSSFNWRVDDGLYYPKGAEVGPAYANQNMHCELIGPNNSFYHADDFTLGLFVLGKHVLYRDHKHQAPEFYLNLTGPTDWRFDFAEWQPFEAGSMIWNHSQRVHATRVGETAFISIYSWLHSIDQKCEVVKETAE